MIEHMIFRQFLKILCMKGLFSLLIASWMNESKDMKPFGETSVLLLRLVKKATIMSDRLEPLCKLRISPLPRLALLSAIYLS